MKKFFLLAVMGTLFLIGLTSMTSMSSAPYPYCQEDCDFLVEIGLFPTHGSCMSACHTCTNNGGGATPAVCLCKIIDALEGLDTYGLNFGQCVTIVKGE